MPHPPTTATFLSKLTLAVIGMAILIGGFVVGLMAERSDVPLTMGGLALNTISGWMMLGGAAWLIISLGIWVLAPSTWDTVAPYIVAVMLAFGILANIVLDSALRLAGIGSIIDPDQGRPWRIALTIGAVAIGFTQWLVSFQLAKSDKVASGAVTRLRISALAVLVLGVIAAWTSPAALVGFLTLAAMIYIAIELVPR